MSTATEQAAAEVRAEIEAQRAPRTCDCGCGGLIVQAGRGPRKRWATPACASRGAGGWQAALDRAGAVAGTCPQCGGPSGASRVYCSSACAGRASKGAKEAEARWKRPAQAAPGPLTLVEATVHATEQAEAHAGTACGREHEQLAGWLAEVEQLRAEVERLQGELRAMIESHDQRAAERDAARADAERLQALLDGWCNRMGPELQRERDALRAELQEQTRLTAEAVRLAEERLAARNHLTAQIEGQQAGALDLMRRFGARSDENFRAFVERLATERDAARAPAEARPQPPLGGVTGSVHARLVALVASLALPTEDRTTEQLLDFLEAARLDQQREDNLLGRVCTALGLDPDLDLDDDLVEAVGRLRRERDEAREAREQAEQLRDELRLDEARWRSRADSWRLAHEAALRAFSGRAVG